MQVLAAGLRVGFAMSGKEALHQVDEFIAESTFILDIQPTSRTIELLNILLHALSPKKVPERPLPLSLVFVFKIVSTFISQNPKFFFMHVLKKDVLLL